MDYKDALVLLETLSERIDDLEEFHTKAFEKAEDFLESVREGVAGMEETIDNSRMVSDKQERAIRNWSSGVEKWFHDD